ncbi:hypothetical protein MFIFM68171_04737 [Madurella fahalii]|uniref:Uncharacterized protein n=1 Tax=Madurella fahalii TaxID=1157608 RepID=A0ABQ0G9T9_9PEZI
MPRNKGGAIAFVDYFTAWVAGPTARRTRKGIVAIISDALDWERRSGATFETEKTAVIHFTRKAYKADSEPFIIKGQAVEPKTYVKVLGVVMDTKLRYREHIARAVSKGLDAAMELKRLRGLSPLATRQLFTTMVAPVMDCASNVWMHECNWKAAPAINRVQIIGAQAIVGTFSTVATSVAEAVRIAVSSSAREGMVGMGGVVRIPLSMRGGPQDETFNMTLGVRTEQNPFSAELAAVRHALRLLRKVRDRWIILATSNKAAVLTLKNPLVWIPTTAENVLPKIAKNKARETTQQNAGYFRKEGSEGESGNSEGKEEWVKFNGLSGNQVLLFQVLDAFLGLPAYLDEENRRRNVPERQRMFVTAVLRYSFRGRLGKEVEERIACEMREIAKRLRLFRTAHRTRAKVYLSQPAPERLPMTAGKSLLKEDM